MPVIKRNESLVDFVSSEIGSVSGLFYLAQKNGISITEDVAPGVELIYLQSEVDLLLKPVKNKAVVVAEYVPEINGVILKKHQNNFDFVCQHAGTMEWIFEMAMLNGISITKIPVPGEVIKVEVADEKTVAAFDNTGYDIASEDENDTIKLPGGIGYMKIESTFIVS